MAAGTRTVSILAGLAACLSASSGAVLAEVATDGTLGRKVRLTGPDVRVGAELGQVRGKNLFHSFERFGVEAGGRVTFTGPEGLESVVSRVTGGEASRIDGTLASEVAGADLYLVNPAGVVFGPGARLDVPGSFHAGAADEVRFADGAAFSARDPGAGVLSVAAPEAFGFLGGPGGAVTVDRAVLAVPAGEALSLVGGAVAVDGDGDGVVVGDPGVVEPEPGALLAQGGRVSLVAVDGAGAVLLGTGETVGDPALGPVRISREGLVDASGDGGGTVLVRGGAFALEGESFIFADNTGALDARAGAGVMIEAAGEARIVSGSRASADSFDGGAGGRLAIRAGRLEVSGGGSVGTNTFGAGASGTVTVEAGAVLLDGAVEGGEFFPSSIQSGVAEEATGDAGSVTVEADSLDVVGGAQIFSGTFGDGDGGTVRVAADAVRVAGATLVGGEPIPSAIVVSNTRRSTGAAGTAVVEAGGLEVRDGGLIGSSASGAGPAGDVSVSAGRLLVEDAAVRTVGAGAAGGRITVAARDLIHLEAAEITSNGIRPEAGASLVTLEAPLIALLDGSRVTSLTGDGDPLTGSGEARLLGDLTFVSEDSRVEGSSTVELAGVDNQVGSDLQLPEGSFVDTTGLLGAGCAERRGAGRASSFGRAGRGGLPPSPDRPLSSAAAGGGAMLAGGALRVAAGGCGGGPSS